MAALLDVLWKLVPVFTAFGVLIFGSLITNRARRREWLAENQKEEFRRILSAVNRLHSILIAHCSGAILDTTEITEVINETAFAANSCIFIFDFLEETKVVGEIIDTSKKLLADGNMKAYREDRWRLVSQIISTAKQLRI